MSTMIRAGAREFVIYSATAVGILVMACKITGAHP